MHVPVAQKPSDEVTSRTRLNRTKALETVGNKISSHRFDVHVIHTLKRKSQEERRQILHDALGKEHVLNIPEGQANAMKADMGIAWYRLNKLRRYTFKQYYCTTKCKVTKTLHLHFYMPILLFFIQMVCPAGN